MIFISHSSAPSEVGRSGPDFMEVVVRRSSFHWDTPATCQAPQMAHEWSYIKSSIISMGLSVVTTLMGHLGCLVSCWSSAVQQTDISYRFCKKIAISVLKSTKNEYRNIGISLSTKVSADISMIWCYRDQVISYFNDFVPYKYQKVISIP